MTEEGRALLTKAEREILAGEREVSDNYEYKVQSLVRNRIRKRLGPDVAVLREHFPEAFELVAAEVCEVPVELDDELRERISELEAENERLRERSDGGADAATVHRHAEAAQAAAERGDRQELQRRLDELQGVRDGRDR